jgi:putative ABC transport system permease protein
MFSYYLKLAMRNFKRAPSLYALVLVTLAIGVGLVSANYALISVMSSDPIPEKSDRLIHISMNTWATETSYGEPLHILRYRDGEAIEKADMIKHSTVFYASGAYARDPESESLARINTSVRATTHGFFPLTNAPFAYGSGFTENSGMNVVIGDELNQQIFGGGNNVGKTIELGGKLFTVAGILKPWNLRPLFYHVTENRAFNKTDDVYVPLETALDLNWPIHARSSASDGYRLLGEARNKNVFFLQAWVELNNVNDRSNLQQYLDNYSQALKDAGEHPLEVDNPLHNVEEWMEKQSVVDLRVVAFSFATILFLIVCVFNASSLLLSRFHAGKFEVGLRRAIGASKKQILYQGLIESTILGLISSLAAIALSYGFLIFSTTLLPTFANLAVLNIDTLIAGILLSIISANLSSLYSIYRANRYSISAELK